MPETQPTGITYTQEIVIGIWKEGVLVAIERKNGHLERYMVTPATWGDCTALFDVDSPHKTV
jgi:hypothetical protein